MSTKFETQLSLSRPFLTRKELQLAHRNTIPDRRTYIQRKLTIFKFLSDVCIHFKFPRRTLETAIYFYQRYYVFNKFETEMCHTVATSCLLLSCKQVETFKKVNELCTISLRLRNVTNIKQETIENFKKRVFQIELRILEACGFDYRINSHVHIDEYIVKLGKQLNLDQYICHLAWVIAYDVLKLDIILMVPQHTIALATLKIASELVNLPNFPLEDKYVEFKTTLESINEAYFDILNYYINIFDTCHLKDNLPVNALPSVNLERFMELKRKAGQESGLKELTEQDYGKDKYLTTVREFSERERRYVLVSKFVTDEESVLSGKKRRL